jgi:hypothetical protein
MPKITPGASSKWKKFGSFFELKDGWRFCNFHNLFLSMNVIAFVIDGQFTLYAFSHADLFDFKIYSAIVELLLDFVQGIFSVNYDSNRVNRRQGNERFIWKTR